MSSTNPTSAGNVGPAVSPHPYRPSPLRWLKPLRVASGLLFFGGLTLALAGTRGVFPQELGHWLASAQFVPSALRAIGGGTALLGLVGLLALTLFAGRIYCSAICPLGILQDIVARASGWVRRKPKLLRYTPPLTVVRQVFLWTSVAAIFIGWGSFALALLDPYSNFGHLVTDFVRPLVRLGARTIANWAGWPYHDLRRGEFVWASAGVLLAASIIPALVVLFSAWRGRLYCNTICPVGTLLGAISRRSYLKLEISREACVNCADCLRSCKAQCIDLRAHRIDHSRCVDCFNCVSVCDSGAITLTPSWGAKPAALAPSAPVVLAPEPIGNNRRTFLRQAGAGAVLLAGTSLLAKKALATTATAAAGQGASASGESPAITPPGSLGLQRFLDQCTGCHLCIGACPTRVLKPAFLEYGLEGLLKPRLDFTRAYCSYNCTACGDACPENAITRLTLEGKHTTRIGTARLNASKCRVCMLCVRQCPTQAITAEHRGGYFATPVVNTDLCIGCGLCEALCPDNARAITVTGCAVHEHRTESPPPAANDTPRQHPA